MSRKVSNSPLIFDPLRPDSAIGKRSRKVDGEAKITGQAIYTDDIQLPRMLHCKLVRSPHAHARILKIEKAMALEQPGVVSVITGQDLPTMYGIIPWTQDEYPLALEKARFVGDAVAAVAATSEKAAEAGAAALEVFYEPLVPILSCKDAKEQTDNIVNEKARRGNVSKHVDLAFGDIDAALTASHLVSKQDYYFANTTHAPIEPHCAVAQMDTRGLLTVWSSTQVPHYLHKSLARVLDIPENRIRVIQPFLGGAFGGKSEPFDLEFAVAKLAIETGRPVKCLYTREEVFYSHRGRHPMDMRFETGVDKEGRITAVRSNIDLDGGAYSSFGLVTAYYAGQLLTAPYQMPTYAFDATRWFTNKPACGPKRGHGSVQPRFAFECQLDEIAHQLSIDPIELRRRNFIGEYTETVNGQRITSNGFLECLDAAERASGWADKYGKLPRGRGIGIAGSMYISGTNYPIYPNDMPQSAVQIRIDRSGRVAIHCGASDIGQGSDSMLASIVSEILGVELDSVLVVSSDTDLCPVDLGAYSSRITFMCGNAAIDGCHKLQREIAGAVAEEWECSPGEVQFGSGRVYFSKDTSKSISFRDAVWLGEAKHGTLGAVGSYNTPKLGGDYRGGTIGASPAYSFTVHIAEVEVDSETGIVEVDKIWVAHDCGRAINPLIVEGQMEGSAYMGYAEAIMEEQAYDDAGRHIGPSLLDYRIPTTLDTPELESLIVESVDPEGPFGAKEAGEGPLHTSIPAIGNAIFDAVGVRLRRIPFYPMDVLRALRKQQNGEE